MFKFPTLYSRSSTGATQQWTITVDGDSFYTVAGQIDGAQTQSKPSKCIGKNLGKLNETSPAEQAMAEAKAKWDKKAKTGYFEDIDKIDAFYYVEPMLAHPLHKVKKGIALPALVQCKWNGGRCIITKDGMFTRKGERYHSAPHIFESLKGFFELHPDAVLDGELFNNDLRQQLNEIMKLIRKSVNMTTEDLARSEKLIRYYVYDGYSMNGTDEDTAYSIRKFHIDNAVNCSLYLKHVPTFLCRTEAEVYAKYNEFIEDGHEGAIIRFADSPYEHKRSNHLIKLKPTDDAEFEITSIEEGSGNWAGYAKIIGLRMADGKEFNASFKGNMQQAAECLKNKCSYIGKKATIFFNGYTGLKVPNYAQFDYNQWMNDKGD